MKLWMLLSSILLLVMTSVAADSHPVSYKSGDETVNGVLYTPPGKAPLPALVVIHEWWGLNDWVKEQATKLADQGYVTLAVDLYRGKVAATPDEAHELSRGSASAKSSEYPPPMHQPIEPTRAGSTFFCERR